MGGKRKFLRESVVVVEKFETDKPHATALEMQYPLR